MEKIGRNEPCPCGSGKKYKKCCINSTTAPKAVAGKKAINTLPSLSPQTGHPHCNNPDHHHDHDHNHDHHDHDHDHSDDEWNGGFEEGPYKEIVELFITLTVSEKLDFLSKKLEETEENLDAELFLDLFEFLASDILETSERERFESIILEFEKKNPIGYQEQLIYFLHWHALNALLLNKKEDYLRFSMALAEIADSDFDLFHAFFLRTAYYGHSEVLLPLIRMSWPTIRTSDEILETAIEDFGQDSLFFECYSFLEQQNPISEWDTDNLFESLKFYGEVVEWDRILQYLRILAGQNKEPLAEVLFQAKIHKNYEFSEDLDVHISNFLAEFFRYLHTQKQIPLSRLELGRKTLDELIFQEIGTISKRHREKREKFFKNFSWSSIFLPKLKNIENFVEEVNSSLWPEFYSAVAFFEILTEWSRFLAQHKFITEEQSNEFLKQILPIEKTNLEHLLEINGQEDPLLVEMQTKIINDLETIP